MTEDDIQLDQAFNMFLSQQQQTDGLENIKRNILKKYSDLDYDSFVGLMGRRNAGEFLYVSACEDEPEHPKRITTVDKYYFILLLKCNKNDLKCLGFICNFFF